MARRSLLPVTLGFARLEPRAPELGPLHRWLDTWRGIGDVAAGMHRQGYDLQLTEYDERGARRSTRAGWSTPRPARPAQRGSRRRGKPCRARRGRR